MPTVRFPHSFLWGVTTAGHQNEGESTASDTWFVENVSPTIFREPSGKACNSWELWEQDLDIIAGMGLNAYRFSAEWARIEPEEGRIDESALDHYEAIVDGCLQRGIAPLITFSHFTAPHWFAKDGGWLDERSAARFVRFCDVVMERFGDRIALAVTLNEPNLPRLLAWILPDAVHDLSRATLAAASKAAGVDRYRVGNVVQPEDYDALEAGLTRAHVAAKAAIKAHRPDLPVGLSVAVIDDVALGDTTLRDRKRAEVYDPWLRLAQDDDFVGVQNYERSVYGPDGELLPPAEDAVMNEMGSAIEPESLAGAVRYAYDIAQVPVLVTEHGLAEDDDRLRVNFLEPSLDGLRRTMDDGVPVLGYFHWTLLDNFEWVGGYSVHMGLYSVDRETFVRTAKPSAAEFARLVHESRFGARSAGHNAGGSIELIDGGIDEADRSWAPPTHLPPGAAEAQHPTGADIHPALTFSMPGGYRPLQLDLYVPSHRAGAVPCVIWIHGGAWLTGTRLSPPTEWPAGAVFQRIVDAGMAVASIDYRHSREAPFPAQLHDAKAAIRYLRRYAAELGLDPDRFAGWGESAGGHLVALLGLVHDPALEGHEGVSGESSALSAIVDYYGVSDVDTMPLFADSLPAWIIEKLKADSAGQEIEPLTVLLADSPLPAATVRRVLSPVHHVTPTAPPFLLIHGEDDHVVPFAQSEELYAALTRADVDVEIVSVPGADHVFGGTDPTPQFDRAVRFLSAKLAD